MGFNIKFYKISDAPNVLNKTVNADNRIGTAAGYDCTPWEPVGVLDGSVVIAYVQDIGTANYAYISGGIRPRYAYVTGFEILPGNQMRVYVKEDALMTFNQGIKESPILATRSSVCGRDNGNVGFNAYLDDGLWKCDSTTLFYLSEDLMDGFFDYDINGSNYILMTAG